MEEKDCVKGQKKVKNWGNGGGLYRGVKASVKTLNIIIVVLMIALVAVVIYLAQNSSYTATYEVNGGEVIEVGQYKYGEYIEVEEPNKTGYTFVGWYQDKDLSKKWDLKNDIVEQSLTLYAKWAPLEIHVLFDLDGGIAENQEIILEKNVMFHETYGELPIPIKEGYKFIGWQYNGEMIEADTQVSMNGEHTLKAIYE